AQRRYRRRNQLVQERGGRGHRRHLGSKLVEHADDSLASTPVASVDQHTDSFFAPLLERAADDGDGKPSSAGQLRVDSQARALGRSERFGEVVENPGVPGKVKSLIEPPSDELLMDGFEHGHSGLISVSDEAFGIEGDAWRWRRAVDLQVARPGDFESG